MHLQRVGGTLGAVIHEIDLASLDDAGFEEVHQARLEHQVVFFRDQRLDPAAHVSSARRFGALHSDRGGRAEVWHSDVSFSATPPTAAVLRQLRGPDAGGDTMWSNQCVAYDAMSPPPGARRRCQISGARATADAPPSIPIQRREDDQEK